MTHQLSNQEVARMRYAETLREATRRHSLLREEPADVTPQRSRRIRLLRRFRPVFGA